MCIPATKFTIYKHELNCDVFYLFTERQFVMESTLLLFEPIYEPTIFSKSVIHYALCKNSASENIQERLRDKRINQIWSLRKEQFLLLKSSNTTGTGYNKQFFMKKITRCKRDSL